MPKGITRIVHQAFLRHDSGLPVRESFCLAVAGKPYVIAMTFGGLGFFISFGYLKLHEQGFLSISSSSQAKLTMLESVSRAFVAVFRVGQESINFLM